jgi:molybdopterin synthase sulfur carrier subunit
MNIRALFFASYRDLAGAGELEVRLPPASRVSDLVTTLRARGGAWDRLPVAPVVAVNMEYAPLAAPLAEGDEVAFIPPVSGG